MKKLIEGVQKFQKSSFRAKQSLFEQLADGQQPLALFITCSDSRIDPNLLTNTEPGELFVLRNAGNIVPPYGSGRGGEAATIEYAVNVLKVDDIIICGHSHCGAMAGLANPESLEGLVHVADWLGHASETARVSKHLMSESDDPLLALAGRNVVAQLDHLIGYPFVRERVASKNLNLHGWVYVFETGDIRVYQPIDDRFVPLATLEA